MVPGARAPGSERRRQIIEAAAHVALHGGLDATTTRSVAARAGLSQGLVHFHFKSKGALLDALLDHLLEERGMPPTIPSARGPAALAVVVRDEIFRHTADPRYVELFFEYWVRGARVPSIRRRIRAQLDRYRDALAQAAGVASGARGEAVFATSLVHGAAVQVVADPRAIDLDALVRRSWRALQDDVACEREPGPTIARGERA